MLTWKNGEVHPPSSRFPHVSADTDPDGHRLVYPTAGWLALPNMGETSSPPPSFLPPAPGSGSTNGGPFKWAVILSRLLSVSSTGYESCPLALKAGAGFTSGRRPSDGREKNKFQRETLPKNAFHGTSIVKRRGIGKWPYGKGITQRKLQPQG